MALSFGSVVDAIKRDNYALLDLSMGIVLLLVLIFPSSLSFLVDLHLTAIFGLLFLMLMAGRGVGTAVVLFLFAILKWIAKTVRFDAAFGAFGRLEMMFLAFMFSCMEATMLMAIVLVLLFPLILMAHETVENIISYYKTNAVIASVAEGVCCVNTDETGRIFIVVLSMALAAFSYFAVFLLKRWDFALLRAIVEPLSALRSRRRRDYSDADLELLRKSGHGDVADMEEEKEKARQKALHDLWAKIYMEMKGEGQGTLDDIGQERPNAQ